MDWGWRLAGLTILVLGIFAALPPETFSLGMGLVALPSLFPRARATSVGPSNREAALATLRDAAADPNTDTDWDAYGDQWRAIMEGHEVEPCGCGSRACTDRPVTEDGWTVMPHGTTREHLRAVPGARFDAMTGRWAIPLSAGNNT